MTALTVIHVPPNMPAHLELGQAVPICQTRLKEAMRQNITLLLIRNHAFLGHSHGKLD